MYFVNYRMWVDTSSNKINEQNPLSQSSSRSCDVFITRISLVTHCVIILVVVAHVARLVINFRIAVILMAYIASPLWKSALIRPIET